MPRISGRFASLNLSTRAVTTSFQKSKFYKPPHPIRKLDHFGVKNITRRIRDRARIATTLPEKRTYPGL
jgi:hypothetical protein